VELSQQLKFKNGEAEALHNLAMAQYNVDRVLQLQNFQYSPILGTGI
jgi:hypothetical protein